MSAFNQQLKKQKKDKSKNNNTEKLDSKKLQDMLKGDKEAKSLSIKEKLTRDDSKLSNDINMLVNEISMLKDEIGSSMWLLGQRFHKIREEKLFEKIENQSYKDFTEFCENHVKMSRMTVYRCINIYQNFDLVTASLHDNHKLLAILSKTKDKKTIDKYIDVIDKEKLSTRELSNKLKEDFPTDNKNEEIKQDSFKAKASENIIHKIDINIDKAGLEISTNDYEKLFTKLMEVLKEFSIKKDEEIKKE